MPLAPRQPGSHSQVAARSAAVPLPRAGRRAAPRRRAPAVLRLRIPLVVVAPGPLRRRVVARGGAEPRDRRGRRVLGPPRAALGRVAGDEERRAVVEELEGRLGRREAVGRVVEAGPGPRGLVVLPRVRAERVARQRPERVEEAADVEHARRGGDGQRVGDARPRAVAPREAAAGERLQAPGLGPRDQTGRRRGAPERVEAAADEEGPVQVGEREHGHGGRVARAARGLGAARRRERRRPAAQRHPQIPPAVEARDVLDLDEVGAVPDAAREGAADEELLAPP